ncbi:hypothetical protein MG290_08065 [Flavobacterium sp. CBA20B-1]|uniref:hypothetical protein n=1 Tax=unclassified Flavobacterium TaxID=196869 RepID=UPI0022255ADA|nr:MULTISPECIES: hypothetical protein [unclassified Flavobacterium]WCM40920.1 hypothetical protein MG290_08065 [Flavobacterium sp. CBA20B-1]
MKKPISKLFSFTLLSLTLAATAVSCSSDDSTPVTEEPTPGETDFKVDRNALTGEITKGHVILTEGTYKLTGKLIVGAGAKLTIKPGVRIEATQLASGQFDAVRYIAVAQGGQIFVEGTAANPVIMTAEVKKPGSWGGLVICGKAPINKGTTATAEVSELTYGGTETNDNSGAIKYLRIEYSGYAYNADKEFNGLSMFGVGKGTTVEYVQVHDGSDDGFEFFGGTVDTKYLVVTNFASEVGDDLFDWTEGWNGMNENWYGKRTNDGNRGIEADNNSNNHMAAPIANPTIKNLTLIGNNGGGENHAMKLRVGTKANFDNVVLSNFGTGFDVEHDEGISYVASGELKATRVKFDNITTKAKGKKTDGSAADVNAIFTEDETATGAGNGTATPTWATGWTVGL